MTVNYWFEVSLPVRCTGSQVDQQTNPDTDQMHAEKRDTDLAAFFVLQGMDGQHG